MEPVAYLLVGMAIVAAAVWGRQRFAAFASQSPDDYEDLAPTFDVRQHLNGPLVCEGVIYGPTGRVASRFKADMMGSWEGNTGTLAETFRYDNGAVQERCWFLEIGETGRIVARADDVRGAGRGWQRGPAVQLVYDLRLAEDAGGHMLSAVDWMYLVDDKTIMNRSQFRKFGIKVAELVATIRPKDT